MIVLASFTILGEPNLLRRFMAKVEGVDGHSGCWNWTGAPGDRSPTGSYGRFRYHGRQERAHRASWRLHNGDIPDGSHVLHKCDNPRCVRPDHLFLGTNDDNVADRVAKGRSGWKARVGEEHPMRKLDEIAVGNIRRRSAAGELGTRLAVEFGVCRGTISEIVSRRKWKHVP